MANKSEAAVHPQWMYRKQGNSSKILHFRIVDRKRMLIISDILVILLATFSGLLIWSYVAFGVFSLRFVENRWHWFFYLPILWLILSAINDYYELRTAAHIRLSAKSLSWSVFELLLVYQSLYFFIPEKMLPRLFILVFLAFATVGSGVGRLARIGTANYTDTRRKVIIVGAGPAAASIWKALREEAAKDYEVVGCVMSSEDPMSLPVYADILGFGAELPELARKHGASELIMAYINEIPTDIFHGLIQCYQQGIIIAPMPNLYEDVTGRVPIDHVGENLWSLILPLDTHSIQIKFNLFIKRILDIILSMIGLVLFAPIFPIIALAVKIDSAGPVLFFQKRTGRGSKPFTVIKFRTMVDNAERKSGPLWASTDDPRVTRLGKFLRKSRIDEIPQLINVLRGDMSIVGPRPERPEFVEILSGQIAFYEARHVVKPGLTGWAQIRFRYGSSVDDSMMKLQYDLYYIRHQSLLLDLLIMAKTIKIMLTFQGQ